jgi:hypothetical protein
MIKKQKREFITCVKCGKHDIGETSTKMICPDCNNGTRKNTYGSPLAMLCRECCPTGHGTHFVGERIPK